MLFHKLTEYFFIKKYLFCLRGKNPPKSWDRLYLYISTCEKTARSATTASLPPILSASRLLRFIEILSIWRDTLLQGLPATSYAHRFCLSVHAPRRKPGTSAFRDLSGIYVCAFVNRERTLLAVRVRIGGIVRGSPILPDLSPVRCTVNMQSPRSLSFHRPCREYGKDICSFVGGFPLLLPNYRLTLLLKTQRTVCNAR